MRWGRTSFKLGNWLVNGNDHKAESWIEFNQRLFNRDEVWLRVFKENAGWDPIPAGDGMFGSPPRDLGVWDPNWLQGHWDEEEKEELRVKRHHVTDMNRSMTEWFFRKSQETGCAFELVIIATLKHTPLVGNGHIDHIIRQELIMMDELQERYPKAKIKVSACNEFDAHHHRKDPWGRSHRLSVYIVDMWAFRRNRDNYGFFEFIVDHGGKDTFDYKCGPGRDTFDWGMIHPVRTRVSPPWYQAPYMPPLLKAANGQPIGATESMYYVDPEDTARAEKWYRNRAGWQNNPVRQMELYINLVAAGFTFIVVHDEKGAQCDLDWPRPETQLEARLREYFGGIPMKRHKFGRIITLGYDDVLGRPPDEGGMENYNRLMHDGMTEAQMRESLIRSEEYAEKNPEGENDG